MLNMKRPIRVALISFLCLLAACSSDASTPDSKAPVSLQAQYSSAVTDARTVAPAEISRYLTPITNENPDLIWEYDWGSSNHVGLSEFVLHGRKVDGSGIAVGIRSVKTTAEYFAT